MRVEENSLGYLGERRRGIRMKYHKIQTIFKRDMDRKGALILGTYSTPEIEYLANNQWMFDEKIDGTNTRVLLDNHKVRFGGKTENAQIPTKLIERLSELFTFEKLNSIFDEEEGFVAKAIEKALEEKQ